MNLSIIIITFNSGKYIRNCLDSILKSLKHSKEYEIIIFDNNSTDDTIDTCESYNNSIRIICNTSNRGYSSSINKAIKKTKFQNILILNPDIVIMNHAIHNLHKALSIINAGIVGPKLLNSDGTFQLSSRRHFPTLGILLSYIFRLNRIFPHSKLFGKYNYTSTDRNIQLDVDSTSGACMMFKKEIYNSVNGFDENFFMYFEDTDFCLRVKNKGFRVIYCPSAEVVHYNDYVDNYSAKIFYFYQSFEKFIYKYKNKIYLGWLVYFLAKLIRHFSYLKKIIYFDYNYKMNNE